MIVAERVPCDLGHDPAGSAYMRNSRYETTINEPGKEPERIVCCQACGMALYQRDAKLLPKDADPERVKRIKDVIENPKVEIPKPTRLPDPPRVERSIGLDPPGYGRSL